MCQEEEFLQLTAQELICLIRKDELNVREEREVYNAVLSWVSLSLHIVYLLMLLLKGKKLLESIASISQNGPPWVCRIMPGRHRLHLFLETKITIQNNG